MLEAFHVVLGAFEKSSIIHNLRTYQQLTALSSISGIGALNSLKDPAPVLLRLCPLQVHQCDT